KIHPKYTRHHAGDGSSVRSRVSPQKPWLSSNFRLKIDGVEEACARVTRIEPISITGRLIQDPVGELRDYDTHIGRLDLSDLVIPLAESRAKLFYDWFEDFVVKGNSSADREKNGTLDFLAPNLTTDFFSLRLSHLGIYKITAASALPGAEIRKVT